jgi:hemimethylated DNA-binding YccV family protein
MPKTDHAKLGDYVQTRHGYKGRVTGIHHSCTQDADWLAMQALFDEEKESRPWLNVLVDGGGSVHVPACTVTKIEPFAFTNPWASFYFNGDSN